jgi:D-alanyl-D-alanine dipeptidase
MVSAVTPHRLRTAFAAALICLILQAGAYGQDRPQPDPLAKEADLFELIKLDPTIKLDIRYARTDNFVGKKVYPEARAFLQRPAAEAVVRVHRKLRKQGLGLVIYDGYRPWTVTKLFWDVTPEDKRMFVANPRTGSRHNRGCAVDLSMYDLRTGRQVPMPSGFDEFTERASPDYQGGTPLQRRNRDLLRSLMEAEGFTVNDNEWWHFDYRDWRSYDIYDVAFGDVRNLKAITGYRVAEVILEGGERFPRNIIALKKGEVFDERNLRKTLVALNASGKFRRVRLNDVSWFPNREGTEVGFRIFLKAKMKRPAR